mmetsp:Transcript_16589/g.23302  ORF Transcript_16589/g.23302 Transcript_16589/m.23302 type:complete len:308 (+) Transcript_16589:233-1156(+)
MFLKKREKTHGGGVRTRELFTKEVKTAYARNAKATTRAVEACTAPAEEVVSAGPVGAGGVSAEANWKLLQASSSANAALKRSDCAANRRRPAGCSAVSTSISTSSSEILFLIFTTKSRTNSLTRAHFASLSILSQKRCTTSTTTSLSSSTVMVPVLTSLTIWASFTLKRRALLLTHLGWLSLERTQSCLSVHLVSHFGRAGLQLGQQEPAIRAGFSPLSHTGTLEHVLATSLTVHLRAGRRQVLQQKSARLSPTSPLEQVSWPEAHFRNASFVQVGLVEGRARRQLLQQVVVSNTGLTFRAHSSRSL